MAVGIVGSHPQSEPPLALTSGSALRKLFSLLAAALVSNGQANAKQLFLRAKPEIAMACKRSWDKLFIVHGFLPVRPFRW